ncbi:MAG: hypothetical protein QOJ32_1792 [Frankiaceae bacterium]|nr:hypothetical protein [Frankiaceae bacterium]
MTEPLLPMSEQPPLGDRPPRRPARPPRRRMRAGRLLIAITALAVVMVLVIVGAGAVLNRLGGGNAPDFKGQGTDAVVVQVPEGATATKIGRVLQDAGVVKSSAAFTSAASKEDAKARGLQPGYYRLKKQMSGSAAFTLLLDPAARAESKFTFPEGLSVRQALPIISKGTGIPVEQLDAAAKQTAALDLPYGAKSVEGFLFPATYTAAPDATPVQILKMMVDRFKQEADKIGLTAGAQKHGITPLQLVTLASIVEREVRNDRAKAATVLYNRLKDKANFPTLGLDSTVRYALGDFPGALSNAQLNVDSPYNTRKNPGIPPGAIGNPGNEALAAMINPEPGTWVYFLSLPKEDKTYYATTTAEFDALRAKLAQQGGSGGY